MGIKSKLSSIRLNKKVIIISVIVLAVVGIGFSSYSKAQKAKVKQVTMSKVSKKKVVQSVSATGNVEAKNRNDIALNPAQKVVKVLVSEGQQVKKGDVLVELDVSEYENQLEKAKLNLANAQATLNQMLSSGIETDRSDASNGLSQAQISLENAQRNYEDLNKKYEQNKGLLNQGYISQNDFDASKKAVEDAYNAVKGAQSALANSKSVFNNVNASSGDKVTAQRTQVALAQADINNFTKKIEDSKIKANIDGVIVKMDAKEDLFPKTGDMIIVDDNSAFKVSIDMNQYDAIKLVKGQKADIKVKGLDKKYSGEVTDIGELAQIKANATDKDYKVSVKVTITNPDYKVKAGYESGVEITINQKDSALAVGFDAIKEEKSTGKKYIYMVNNKNKVEKKYIKTGTETDYDVEVIDGLKEGDKYIVSPPETIHEGDEVAEAANKNGGTKK